MTDSRTRTGDDRQGVLRAAGMMAAGGLVFMVPVVGFPGVHANFDDDPAARLAGLEAHFTNFWIGSVLFSIGWLLMGVGLFLLCRSLAALETGRSASVLRATGPMLLVPFLVLAVVYVSPDSWGMSAAEYAASSDEPQAGWLTVMQMAVVVVILLGWMTVSVILARSEHWPTWLGITFGVLGLATIVTQLPLFAAIGAIVLGVTVWRRARRGAATAPQPA
jgi:hypothetical protein